MAYTGNADLSAPYSLSMKTVTLAKEVINAQMTLMLDEFGIPSDKLRTDMVIYEVSRQLVAKVRIYFLKGMASPVTKTVLAPKSAWQHFKHQFFPALLKKYFPVKYDTHSFQVQGPQYLCPHLDQVGNGPHVSFAMQTARPTMKEMLGR